MTYMYALEIEVIFWLAVSRKPYNSNSSVT